MRMGEKLQINAAILAGGQAKRLDGIVKGNIEISQGLTIIQNLINELNNTIIQDMIIVANDHMPYEQYQKTIVSDLYSKIGPLGGIVTGLNYYKTQKGATLFLPCDLPFLSQNEIVQLLDFFYQEEPSVVFAKINDGTVQPLFSIVNNSLLPNITVEIVKGERRVGKVWADLNAKVFLFEDNHAFFNLNTKDDLLVLHNVNIQ